MSIFGKKVVVIGAHPDDLEMNAGGTIHKLVEQGCTVAAITLCKCEHGRVHEASEAHKRLGIQRSLFMTGDDRRLHAQKSEMIERVDELLKDLAPTSVITHYHYDTHQDHSAAYEIVQAAARNVQNFFMFNPIFPSGRSDIPFHGNYVSQLSSDDMIAKLEAMRAFESQMHKYGAGHWITALQSVAVGDAWRYGGFHGYAELFQISRLVS